MDNNHGNSKPHRAAIYTRVSSDRQVEGTSLGTQSEQCAAYIEAHGWDVAGVWTDDGVSGTLGSRPALDEMLASIRRGEVDVVVVAKLDRLARSMRHLTSLLADWEERGVGFVSVGEAIDSTSLTGKLLRNVLGSIAEFEAGRITERTREGREAAAASGRFMSRPPYGWELSDDAVHPSGLVVVEDQAEVLRTVWRLIVEEHRTTRQAAEALNELGHRSPVGKRWRYDDLRRLLLSLPLSGTWVWRGARAGRKRASEGPEVPIEVPAIMSVEDHQRLISRLASTQHTKRGGGSIRYLLAGRVESPHGAPMYGTSPTNRPTVYRCRDLQNDGRRDRERCDCKRISGSLLEETVWGEIVTVLADHDKLIAGLEHAQHTAQRTEIVGSESASTLRRKVSRLEKAIGETIADLAADGMDRAAIRHATAALRDKLTTAREHLERAQAWETAQSEATSRVADVFELTQRLGNDFKLASTDDRELQARIIDLLDVRVTIQGWDECPECGGTGKIAGELVSTTIRRRGNTAVNCTTCRAMRHVPRIKVRIAIPLPGSDAEAASEGGIEAV